MVKTNGSAVISIMVTLYGDPVPLILGNEKLQHIQFSYTLSFLLVNYSDTLWQLLLSGTCVI